MAKKNKIGILTFPLNSNYGNLLQAFALITFLKKLGYDVELIDKQRIDKSSSYGLQKIKSYFKNIIALTLRKWLILKYPHYYFNKAFILFINRYIKPKTNQIFDEKGLIDNLNKKKYDAIIVGSDQVWRKDYLKKDIPFYFLSFVPDYVKKIAYSASFGVDYWQFDTDQTDLITGYLSSFSGISVREDSAVELIKKHIHLEVKHIIDPTLLLNIEDYLNLLSINDASIDADIDNYLFSYILDDNSEKKKAVEIIMKIKNLESNIAFSLKDIKINNRTLFTTKPVELWLEKMYYSEFVVTDSFHGSVFAILFNKPFVVIPNKERGFTRFTSLLKIFGLEDRLVEDKSEIETLIKREINWSIVNSIISDKKREAIDFINNSIR